MAGNKAITVVTKRPPLVPPALGGAIAGADLGLFAYIVDNYYFSQGPLLLLTLFPSLAVAGLVAVAAYEQRRGGLSRLNRDLIHLSSMAERGLIDSEDYQRLKVRLVEEFQPQRVTVSSIVKPALWAALVTSLVPLLISGAFTSGPVGIFFATLFGSAALGALATSSTTLVHWLIERRRYRALPSGERDGWQPLGTRKALPPQR